MRRAENWKSQTHHLVQKPTGWRPENFEEKYPVTKISDVYHFEKYGLRILKTDVLVYFFKNWLLCF